MKELSKAYDPHEHEDGLYKAWEESGFFNPDKLLGKRTESYCIVMPPPNVTGTLHLGHAVMLAIEDIMVRFARMQGKKALWIPGTDHASIATQTKVEKLIWEKEKKTRHDLGREEFLSRVRAFAQESHDTIVNQVRKMGSSCDWSREAYTLDEKRGAAVFEAFKCLHDLGLIYRGNRVVNWCPRCASTLADDEVVHKEGKAMLYTFKYSKDFPISISTTRPETKLGDAAVAVHPSDERYASFVGKTFDVDFCGQPLKIKIVADRNVEKDFGTGALGVTPAHSSIDEKIAKDNDVTGLQIIGEDGRMTASAGKFVDMTVVEARTAVVEELRSLSLIEKEEEVPQNLSVCYRCSTAIEPLPKLQWFIAVNKSFVFHQGEHPISGLKDGQEITLKELMLHVVRVQDIKMVPERFEKTYFHWIENLRDWNISRQIWFGHRVPVWYNGDELRVSDVSPGKDWTQDPDTFDTWFSSGLWTFSTLGWPDKSADFKFFHPTAVLETGYDILPLWVSRMILMTTVLTGEVPFKNAYLHGLIRDEQGRKMSKSLGNIIDPLDMIAKYGTDAVRLSLVIGTSPGNDMKLSEEKIAGFRNFTNKLWNIGRYVLTTTNPDASYDEKPESMTLADHWILARLSDTWIKVDSSLKAYNFSGAGEALRDFTWGDFADWYLEITKVQSKESEERQQKTDQVLRYVLHVLLKLWHPFMPFVTEVLWKELTNGDGKDDLLMVQDWPKVAAGLVVWKNMELYQSIVTTIRNLRAEHNVEAKEVVSVFVENLPEQSESEIAWMERLSKSKISAGSVSSSENIARSVIGNMEISLVIPQKMDTGAERERIEKEIENLETYVRSVDAKLTNDDFVKRAPAAVVAKEKEKRDNAVQELAKLKGEVGGV